MARQRKQLERVNERQYENGYVIAKYGKYYYNWYFAVFKNDEEIVRFDHFSEAEEYVKSQINSNINVEYVGEEEVIYDAANDNDEWE